MGGDRYVFCSVKIYLPFEFLSRQTGSTSPRPTQLSTAFRIPFHFQYLGFLRITVLPAGLVSYSFGNYFCINPRNLPSFPYRTHIIRNRHRSFHLNAGEFLLVRFVIFVFLFLFFTCSYLVRVIKFPGRNIRRLTARLHLHASRYPTPRSCN